MILLAVDPAYGQRARIGVAKFDRGTLVDAAALKVPKIADIAARCALGANLVAEWCGEPPAELVIEWQEAFPGESVSRLNSLLGLTGLCGAVAHAFYGATVRSVLPAQWTRGVPKAKTKSAPNPRHARVRARLDRPGERQIALGLNHDGLDAVGLGLWHLGRFDARRVFAGAKR